MEAHGADALRWFMAAGGSPWSARRVELWAIVLQAAGGPVVP